MDQNLLNQLKQLISGDIATDQEVLNQYATDKSIFSVQPQAVISPKNTQELKQLVQFVTQNKKQYPHLSLTARAAGTCLSGGSLNDSIIVSFMRYFNHEPSIHGGVATVEPGVLYRDFERYITRHRFQFPPYPASKMQCAMGGIISNNASGEKSLAYGQTATYVKTLRVVLADGNEYTLKALTEKELQNKLALQTFEGKLYRKMHHLIMTHYDLLMKSKPSVSKNTAGYALWDVYDRKKKLFDLTKLFTGAQGTLGMITSAQLELMPIHPLRKTLLIHCDNLIQLANIVNRILPFHPESVEAYDDTILNLAMRYHNELGQQKDPNTFLGSLAMFAHEHKMKLFGGLPKLSILVSFSGDNHEQIRRQAEKVYNELAKQQITIKHLSESDAEEKYWHIRRDSVALITNKVKTHHALACIDDIVISPADLPEFMPKLLAILNQYPYMNFTFSGHVGNGHLQFLPLIDTTKNSNYEQIRSLCEAVFKLVQIYHGSISGENNDGLIRTPFLHLQYSKKLLTLFKETKNIFDPECIFNPHKKTNPDPDFAMNHLKKQ